MRIAVDARELCGRPTGVGRYLSELFREWSVSPEAQRHEWTLYAHEQTLAQPPWAERARVLDGAGGTAWEQVTLTRALNHHRPDVLFSPAYTTPLASPAPTVLTVHDVSFFAHPEWFGAREGMRRRWITRWSARRARLVITDSEFSRQEIARLVGVSGTKVRVITPGMRRIQTQPGAVSREPIVLYVGSVFERRRVDQLIEHFDRVVDRVPDARLEIVGENRTAHPRVDLDALRARSRRPDRITIRSYVDETTLRDLYARASVFAFLSEYEGFGLTPLEALGAGVAPVLLDTPVAREVCGPAARYVAESAGPDSVVDVLVNLLDSRDARDAILGEARNVLARYDWSRTASATLSALEEGAGAR